MIENLKYNPIISLNIMAVFSIVMLIIIIINRKHVINRILIIALLFIISQRPMLPKKGGTIDSHDLNVVFVIDNTVSMNAIDVNGGERLKAVKNDCKRIIENLSGSNFAIITYGNIGFVNHPGTTDIAEINEAIDTIKVIDPYYAAGSTLDLPYKSMKTLLTGFRNKEEGKNKTVVFFMGDGELNRSEQTNTNLDVYKDLSDMIDNGAVMGYGTLEGAKIRITESVILDKVAPSGFLVNKGSYDSKSQVAISKLNEGNLKQVASNLSLDYYHMTDYSAIDSKIQKIKSDTIIERSVNEESFVDIYYYFSIALVCLLGVELLYYRRNA